VQTIRSLAIVAAITGLSISAESGASPSPRASETGVVSGDDSHHALLEGLQPDGRGSLSWLGIRIYDATLWTEYGDFATHGFEQRIVLRIDYQRAIRSDRLVATTRKEWQRLAAYPEVPGDDATEAWLDQVAAIWPDVEPGDFILTVVEPGGSSYFYGVEGLLGVIDDSAFGPAFLSIWLHPRTSRPDLRASLIGDTAGGG